METTSSPTSSAPSKWSNGAAIAGAALWLILALAQLALAFVGSSSDGGERELIYDYEFAIGVPIVYGIVIGLTIAIATAYGSPFEAIGLRGFRFRWVGIAIAVVFVAFLVEAIFSAAFGFDAGGEQGVLPETWRPERLPALILNTFVTVTLVPFAEELFFRGLGVRALRIFGSIAAIVGTALIFALAHGILVAVPGLFAFALGLAWVRLRADSIWPGVVAHGLYNGVVVAIALAVAFA